jgi:hypothetical protein
MTGDSNRIEQSLSVVHLHLVFWTKDRRPFLPGQKLREAMHFYFRQDEHHRKMTFQEELRALLRKHRQEWDERYLWD